MAALKLMGLRWGDMGRMRRFWLANPGNADFSIDSHLHFAIQRNVGMDLALISFEFTGVNGDASIPIAATYLTAY